MASVHCLLSLYFLASPLFLFLRGITKTILKKYKRRITCVSLGERASYLVRVGQTDTFSLKLPRLLLP